MLETARPIAFAATSQVDRARRFYCGILGLKLREENAFALVLDAQGVELRIQKVARVVPVPYTQFGFVVDAIEMTVDRLFEAGVEFVRFRSLKQDARGIWRAPGGGRVAWFRDPDGNLLSLTQTPIAAARETAPATSARAAAPEPVPAGEDGGA